MKCICTVLYIWIKYEKSAILKSVLLKSSFVTKMSRQKINTSKQGRKIKYYTTIFSYKSTMHWRINPFDLELLQVCRIFSHWIFRYLNFTEKPIFSDYWHVFSEFLFYVANFCHGLGKKYFLMMYSKNTSFHYFFTSSKALLCLFVHTRVSKYISR